MTESIIVNVLVAYGLIALCAVAVPLSRVSETGIAYKRKRLARIAIANIVWPLWIPIGIVYGIYRWIQIARTGR